MKEILDFLTELSVNNNRQWFNTNKERYLHVQNRWNNFALSLRDEIAAFDPAIAQLDIKDITYRIYRDTRFSADKSPYKTYFGTFLAPGGKHSPHSGYYFQIGVPDRYIDATNILATGNYIYDKHALHTIREDVHYGWDSFKDDVIAHLNPRFELMDSNALKRVPNGFPTDSPAAEWLKLKSFGVETILDDNDLYRPDLPHLLATLFATTKPLNDFINRAIDFREV